MNHGVTQVEQFIKEGLLFLEGDHMTVKVSGDKDKQESKKRN